MDKTFLLAILLFLTILAEIPLIFPLQPVPAAAVQDPIIIPPVDPGRTNSSHGVVPAPTTQPPLLQPESTPDVIRECTVAPLTKVLKDSRLWYSVSVPQDWNASTSFEGGYGTWTGLYFYTNLGVEEPATNQTGGPWRINASKVFIMTYTINKNQDQDYRNYYRDNWKPVPVESVETINGIVFNRFESKGAGTAVAYVAKKSSANERGLATLIRFYVGEEECLEEREAIVHSFRYLTARQVWLGSEPGIEISIPAI